MEEMKEYFIVPTVCPNCFSKLEHNGEYLLCINFNCSIRVQGRISNWINELDIKEWGVTLVKKLVEAGKVTTVADLYKLTVTDLASIDRMGQKSAQNCFNSLWTVKEVPLEVLLGGLSIPMIGQSTIKAIMGVGCDTLEKFGQLNAEQFEKVPGVGPTKAKSLADGLKENQQLILDILDNGLKIKVKTVGKLTNKSFCFTGIMENKRTVLEKMVADAGGEVKSSVGKGLTYLIINDLNSASSKAVSAKKLGTSLVSEKDFLEMVK